MMVIVLLVFAVLCLLTFGIMMVAAVAALPPQRFRTARYQAEEKSLALLRSWLTPRTAQAVDTRSRIRSHWLRYGQPLSDQ
jgi:hypothetical protein